MYNDHPLVLQNCGRYSEVVVNSGLTVLAFEERNIYAQKLNMLRSKKLKLLFINNKFETYQRHSKRDHKTSGLKVAFWPIKRPNHKNLVLLY